MIKYVEMKCELDTVAVPSISLPENFSIKLIQDINQEGLYECYYQAFSQGDAKFFFLQGEDEKREYFDSLGFDEVENDSTSFGILEGENIVGFSIVLHREEKTNRHISCMCIHPEYQGLGYGKFMLYKIMNEVISQGVKTITLGTEPEMIAYKLYESNGFQVTAEHIID